MSALPCLTWKIEFNILINKIACNGKNGRFPRKGAIR